MFAIVIRTATIELGDNATIPGELDLVITGFNYFPHETTVMILSPEGAYVLVNNTTVASGSDNIIEYGESVNIDLELENVGNDSSSDLEGLYTTCSALKYSCSFKIIWSSFSTLILYESSSL